MKEPQSKGFDQALVFSCGFKRHRFQMRTSETQPLHTAGIAVEIIVVTWLNECEAGLLWGGTQMI